VSPKGESIAKEMAQPVRLLDGRSYPGLRWTRADKRPGSRVPGWKLVRAYLKHAYPTERGAREKPGLFVFNTCEDFKQVFPNTPRSLKNRDDVDTDAEDHMADEVRYRLTAGGQWFGDGTVSGMY
jgi:hypothetical protein